MAGIDYCLVVTSDRVYAGLKEDRVTPIVSEILSSMGRRLVQSEVVPNRVMTIREAVARAAARCRIVLVTGGTGISPRDMTVEAVEALSIKRVPGLGEEFRRRSIKSVGPRAYLSGASGYVVPPGSLVFVSPGNPDAVRVALEILVEIDEHVVEELAGRGHA